MGQSIQFKIPAAINYAMWSIFAYGKSPIPSNIKYEWVTGLPKEDAQCLVIYLADKTIFAFRGTDNIHKFLIDAQIRFKHLHDGIKVHTGFWNSLDSMWDKLANIACKSIVPCYTTGHSLGAAQARIFTYRLATEKKIFVKQSITLGEPRSFNHKGANSYNFLQIPTFRVEDDADIICNLPWCLGSYWHVLQNVYIDSWLNIEIGEPWFAHLFSDAYEIICGAFKRQNALISDHSSQLYYDKLQKIQNNLF